MLDPEFVGMWAPHWNFRSFSKECLLAAQNFDIPDPGFCILRIAYVGQFM